MSVLERLDIVHQLKVNDQWTSSVGVFAFRNAVDHNAFYVSPSDVIPFPSSWPAPRRGCQATRVDNNLYITGGVGHGHRLDIFNLPSQKWSRSPDHLCAVIIMSLFNCQIIVLW